MKPLSRHSDLSRRALLTAVLLAGPAASALAGEELLTRRAGDNRPGRPTSPNLVKATQKALNEEGYNAGAVDGLMGPKTRAAIRSYQEAKEMEQTGEIDRRLLISLRLITE